ncbi:MAG TPA: hypothetical protein VKB78_15925 [Pirellulales bacterium]|nr:hypothetical protein [Pirellulales bacterium]
MPVRFLCPACHQLLSIGTRKIGAEVDCPKCRSTIIVPDPRESHAGGQPTAPFPAEEPPSLFAQTGLDQALSAISSNDKHAAQTAPEPTSPYDSSPSESLFPVPKAAKRQTRGDDSYIMISRRILYLQAALLAIVAIMAFVCGYVIGGAAR